MNNLKTTPGAMRAAQRINAECFKGTEYNPTMVGRWQRIIERETAKDKVEMLEALQALQALMDEYKRRMDGDYPGENLHQFQPAYKMARAAISAATGEGKIG